MREHQSAVLAHQHVSLARIGRRTGTGTLFDTLVVFDVATDVDALRRPDDTLVITDIVNEGAPHYPLTLVVERTLEAARASTSSTTANCCGRRAPRRS